MKKKNLLFCISCLLGFTAFGQTSYTDSLQQLLKVKTTHREQLLLQYKIADRYRLESQNDKAIQWAERSLTADNPLSNAKNFMVLADIYRDDQDYESAKNYIDSIYFIAENNSLRKALTYAYYADGKLQEELDNPEGAVSFYSKSLEEIEQNNPTELLLKARLYYFLYGIYIDWSDDEEAYKYINKTITLTKEVKDYNLLASAYAAKAFLFSNFYDSDRKPQHLDSLMHYSDLSMHIAQKYDREVTVGTSAFCMINNASYYLKYFDAADVSVQQKVADNTGKALQILQSSFGNENLYSSGLGILSTLEIRKGNYDKAEEYLLQGYSLLLMQNRPDHFYLIRIQKALAELYVLKKDYLKAYNFQQLINESNEKLTQEKVGLLAKKLKTQFEFEKKDAEIDALLVQTERQQKQKRMYIGLIALGGIGAFFMFRSYHLNLKYSLTREKQLQAEQQEAAVQLELEKEEQKRLKAERELMSLKQQQMQNEILASQLHLQHKNEVLSELKEKLSVDEKKKIGQILKDEMWNDNNFEEVKFQLQKIHPNFFQNLQNKAQKKLTQLDLKYCSYLYLGMETKQVAELMKVAPKSVRTTKYRLKKKFGIGENIDLIEYLQENG